MSTGLNSYYTRPEVAEELMKLVYEYIARHKKGADHWYLEPAAGTGAFYDLLPPDRRLGLEVDLSLESQHPDYMYLPWNPNEPAVSGFLGTTKKQLGLKNIPNSQLVVVGNPPFTGPNHRQHLAVKFINHAASMADTIAMVVGASDSRRKIRSKGKDEINPRLHLVMEEMLPNDAFVLASGEPFNVPAVFQIWAMNEETEDRGQLRPRSIIQGHWTWPDGSPGDFMFVNPGEPFQFVVTKWGSVNSLGKVITDPSELDRYRDEDLARYRRWTHMYETGESNKKRDRHSLSRFYIQVPVLGQTRLVAQRLQSMAISLQEYLRSTRTKSNPVVTESELVHFYLQNHVAVQEKKTRR